MWMYAPLESIDKRMNSNGDVRAFIIIKDEPASNLELAKCERGVFQNVVRFMVSVDVDEIKGVVLKRGNNSV